MAYMYNISKEQKVFKAIKQTHTHTRARGRCIHKSQANYVGGNRDPTKLALLRQGCERKRKRDWNGQSD